MSTKNYKYRRLDGFYGVTPQRSPMKDGGKFLNTIGDIGKTVVNTVVSPIEHITGSNFYDPDIHNKKLANTADDIASGMHIATDIAGNVATTMIGAPGAYEAGKQAVRGVTKAVDSDVAETWKGTGPDTAGIRNTADTASAAYSMIAGMGNPGSMPGGNAKGATMAQNGVEMLPDFAAYGGRLKHSNGGIVSKPGYQPVGMRPSYNNKDGTYSNEVSVGMEVDGLEMLLPSYWDGKRHNDKEVLEQYRKTGEHLGAFKSRKDAERGAHLREFMNNNVYPYSKAYGGPTDPPKSNLFKDYYIATGQDTLKLDKVNAYLQQLAETESFSGKQQSSEHSSAKGYYHYLDDAVKTSDQRIRNLQKKYKFDPELAKALEEQMGLPVDKRSREMQDIMVLSDHMQSPTAPFKDFMSGKVDAAELYYRGHHTADPKAISSGNKVKENWNNAGIRLKNRTAEYAYGGSMNNNMKKLGYQYAAGGPLQEINAGGTHEQNPMGGVPITPNASVEEGETIKDDFVYSDRIKVNKTLAKEFNLPKSYIGKTFADASKILEKANNHNDHIDRETNDRIHARLAEAHEAYKAKTMPQMGMQPQMGYGGMAKYQGGGTMKAPDKLEAIDYTLPPMYMEDMSLPMDSIQDPLQNIPMAYGGRMKYDIGGDLKRNAKWDEFLGQEGVKEKIQSIAEKHGFSPQQLLAVIEFETAGSMSPSAANPDSSATGLIQFMDATAKDLGTTKEDLSNMSTLEQLEYVERYYDKYHKYGDHPYDVVIASSSGKFGEDHILYKKGSKEAEANPSWQDKNGNVTKKSARNAILENNDYTGFSPSEEASVPGKPDLSSIDPDWAENSKMKEKIKEVLQSGLDERGNPIYKGKSADSYRVSDGQLEQLFKDPKRTREVYDLVSRSHATSARKRDLGAIENELKKYPVYPEDPNRRTNSMPTDYHRGYPDWDIPEDYEYEEESPMVPFPKVSKNKGPVPSYKDLEEEVPIEAVDFPELGGDTGESDLSKLLDKKFDRQGKTRDMLSKLKDPSMLQAAPILYNTIQGLRNPQTLDKDDYMTQSNVTAQAYNIQPRLSAARDSFATSQKNIANRAGKAGTYLSNVNDLYGRYNQVVGQSYAEKENQEAQSIQRAEIAKDGTAQFNSQMGYQVDDWNARSLAARDNHLTAAVGQLGQIGANEDYYDYMREQGRLLAPNVRQYGGYFYKPRNQ